MKTVVAIGDRRTHHYRVKKKDVAAFQGEVVHEVCSTYTLVREMEWAGRLFVLELRESTEEGIGTMVEIHHNGPAYPGDELIFISEVESLQGNELICRVDVSTATGREVATGRTGQKILPKSLIRKKFQP